jgi:hypothetical protein
MNYILLITSIATQNATARMRIWRGLKASGAAVLRDGVYLMPDLDGCRYTLEGIAAEVVSCGGNAFLLRVEEPAATNFSKLFSRDDDYAALLSVASRVRTALTTEAIPKVTKEIRKLRKQLTELSAIDFFSGAARLQVDAAINELELTLAHALSPDEPIPVAGRIPKREIGQFQGKIWATRSRPWVDRLASAWLIRRFIDPHAVILWLASPSDCPDDALGFDFDGASFSHTGGYVTFEVLLMSFGLEQPGLKRLAALIHYLDVGGVQPPESIGIESVLMGMKNAITDDDQLLMVATSIFEGLLANFAMEAVNE